MGDAPSGLEEPWLTLDAPAPPPEPSPAFADPWIVGGIALVLGLLVDTLAFHQPPGIGLALGLWITIGAVALTRVLLDVERPRSVWGFTAVGIVLAGFVAVRSSPVLVTFNAGAAILIVAVISQLRSSGDLKRWTLAAYLTHPLGLSADAARGAGSFLAIDLRSDLSDTRRRRLRAVALGIAVGVPIVLVFTALFAAADVTFDAYLSEVTTTWSLLSVFWRIVWSVTVAAAIVGLWRTARRPRPRVGEPPSRTVPRLDPRSAITALVLLVVLFALFVLTQVLGHNPDLVSPQDYSDNARSGFFQLLAVTGLVVTLLLVFDWLIRSNGGPRSAGFDRLAVALIILTGIVMTSAMSRMRLYVNEFGFTELRVYTSVFMVWLGFVLAWFIATVLRDRHSRFAFGLLVSALAVIILLNGANPDARIAQYNWDRHLAGEEFAEEYTSGLSVDAIPVLVGIVETSDEQLCVLESSLVEAQRRLVVARAVHGPLSDSWSEVRARRALDTLDRDLTAGC